MIGSIVNDIRYQFQSGNTITRLIIVNIAVFLALMLMLLILRLGSAFNPQDGRFGELMQYMFLSGDILWVAKHPWTIVTHMFTHTGFFHLLFNMLILYWFGRIAGDLLGDHRMLPLYIYSGLSGALFYLITAPFLYGGGSNLHGASAAIMGIVAAAGLTAPDYQMRLLIIGDVRLKYIVVALLAIYIIGIANLENVGGHLAHLGGAAFGFLYVHMLRQGRDLAGGFIKLTRRLKKSPTRTSSPVRHKVKLTVQHRSGEQVERKTSGSVSDPLRQQERLDAILDKIKISGYQSLSDEEKKFLDDASQK